MASEDKSLDDFFAKKDKGKKGKTKGKGKFTTSSAITKQVENAQKTVEQSKEQKLSSSQTANSQKEDEWLDFNEPKEKDYSGLKVQPFQIRDKPDDEADEESWADDDGDGDVSSEKKEKTPSVWQPVAQPIPQAEPPKEEVKKEVKGVYVPPSLRGNKTSESSVNDQSWKYRAARRDPRRPPEIDSEIAFPSLQISADVSSKSEEKSNMNYEPVRHGARASTEQSMNRRTNIDIGNKFDALSK